MRKNIVGLSIKRLRLAHGLTQEQLAVQMQLRGLSLTKLTAPASKRGGGWCWIMK